MHKMQKKYFSFFIRCGLLFFIMFTCINSWSQGGESSSLPSDLLDQQFEEMWNEIRLSQNPDSVLAKVDKEILRLSEVQSEADHNELGQYYCIKGRILEWNGLPQAHDMFELALQNVVAPNLQIKILSECIKRNVNSRKYHTALSRMKNLIKDHPNDISSNVLDQIYFNLLPNIHLQIALINDIIDYDSVEFGRIFLSLKEKCGCFNPLREPVVQDADVQKDENAFQNIQNSRIVRAQLMADFWGDFGLSKAELFVKVVLEWLEKGYAILDVNNYSSLIEDQEWLSRLYFLNLVGAWYHDISQTEIDYFIDIMSNVTPLELLIRRTYRLMDIYHPSFGLKGISTIDALVKRCWDHPEKEIQSLSDDDRAKLLYMTGFLKEHLATDLDHSTAPEPIANFIRSLKYHLSDSLQPYNQVIAMQDEFDLKYFALMRRSAIKQQMNQISIDECLNELRSLKNLENMPLTFRFESVFHEARVLLIARPSLQSQMNVVETILDLYNKYPFNKYRFLGHEELDSMYNLLDSVLIMLGPKPPIYNSVKYNPEGDDIQAKLNQLRSRLSVNTYIRDWHLWN